VNDSTKQTATRLIDVLSLALMIAAGVAFTQSLQALGEERDLHGLYWLVVGGLVLKASVDLLRPGR
jgi:hypothetical protein